jgi:hypothetical protein
MKEELCFNRREDSDIIAELHILAYCDFLGIRLDLSYLGVEAGMSNVRVRVRSIASYCSSAISLQSSVVDAGC